MFASQQATVDLFIASQNKTSDTGMVSDSVHSSLISFLPSEVNQNVVVVHWLYQVANFWQHRLTLLRIQETGFKELSTLTFKGQIKSFRVDGSMITVDQIVYGKNDPRCCPTVGLTTAYVINGDQFVLAEKR